MPYTSISIVQHLQKGMASTVTGKCGRVYTLGSILQRPRQGTLGIHQAEYVKTRIFTNKIFMFQKSRCRGETYAVKRVPPSRFGGLQRLETLLGSSQHLRVHTDYNEVENLLIYPFYRSTLLGLMQEYPDFPPEERRAILRRVGEGLQELHSRDWMHSGNVNRI